MTTQSRTNNMAVCLERDSVEFEFEILPCGATVTKGSTDDDDHYCHHLNTLLYLLSNEKDYCMLSDHCHLDGRDHSLDAGYCGIYELELDRRLESAYDTIELNDFDSCDEIEYDLESLEQYSPVYDRSINPWSSFAIVDLEESVSDSQDFSKDEFGFDFESLTGSNLTLNEDFINDNDVSMVNQNQSCDVISSNGNLTGEYLTNQTCNHTRVQGNENQTCTHNRVQGQENQTCTHIRVQGQENQTCTHTRVQGQENQAFTHSRLHGQENQTCTHARVQGQETHALLHGHDENANAQTTSVPSTLCALMMIKTDNAEAMLSSLNSNIHA